MYLKSEANLAPNMFKIFVLEGVIFWRNQSIIQLTQCQ